MIGHAEELLHFIELGGQDGVVGVFLAVDRLGFQRSESSENGSGTALAPMRLKVSINTGLGITRSLMPLKSSNFSIGRALLVTLRKPFSQ